MEKPCLTCTRVKDPSNCEKKKCVEWQKWFVKKWNEMRGRLWRKGESNV